MQAPKKYNPPGPTTFGKHPIHPRTHHLATQTPRPRHLSFFALFFSRFFPLVYSSFPDYPTCATQPSEGWTVTTAANRPESGEDTIGR